MEGETSTVTAILDPAAHTGMGANNKPWTQALVELENGAQIRIFMPIKVGAKVESYKNSTYTNWRVIKPGTVDTAEQMKLLSMIYEDIQLIKKMVAVEDEKPTRLDDI